MGRRDRLRELWGPAVGFAVDFGPVEGERGAASLESWGQIDIAWDDSAIEQRVHAIADVVLGDRRWVGEGIISELLRQYSLGLIDFRVLSLANTQLLKLDVTNSALASAILELIRRLQAKLIPDQTVPIQVLRIARQEGIFLLLHDLFQRSIDQVIRQWLLI